MNFAMVIRTILLRRPATGSNVLAKAHELDVGAITASRKKAARTIRIARLTMKTMTRKRKETARPAAKTTTTALVFKRTVSTVPGAAS